ncbi:MAG: hypothetical protein JGK03_05295 [Microcoleus sp. PH2017_25_DOB_D_A]|uniref:hypothetical protein n=1 Tax=Microcoleus sp. PH2017_25_DOB_D_A TaxID=2798835 RepID=UPI001D8D3B38|nr:hypothetical protein [Microcoleus sp. PH2017_25_DOB_D_A]MCC3533617.1 hypothetical protein [Microcoleus sp. PH2017_25_DOB_D_A]
MFVSKVSAVSRFIDLCSAIANACRADKIVKLTNYREIICVYQCLFQKYLRLADS